MKIGVAGLMTLSMLEDLLPSESGLPRTFSCPLVAMLARKLHERGHEIAVFALSHEVRSMQLFKGNNIEAYVCPLRRPRSQMADFFRGERRALSQAMRESRCDVIHAHWTYEFGAAAIESGLPHVITAHDNPFAVLRFARHPYWLEKPLLGFPVIRAAKRLTAVSPYAAASLCRIGRRNDVTVIGNGVPSDIFALHGRRKPAGRGPIVFAATLNYWKGRKNGPRLVEAFAKVRARLGSGVELRLFGFDYGPQGPAAAWSRANGKDSGIRFCGAVAYADLLQNLAEEVDILVHPALEEAHCMAVIEAMAIGLPVIGGERSGGMAWTLGDGKAGMLVNVKSADAMARGMQTLAEDAGLRNSLAVEARKLAVSDYCIDRTVDRYLACLTDAAQDVAA